MLALAWAPPRSAELAGLLASAGAEGAVKLWRGARVAKTLKTEHTDAVRALAWNASGARLASASSDCTVRLWSFDAQRLGDPHAVLVGHGAYITSIDWSPDGSRLATGSGDGTVRVWHPATETVIRTNCGHKDGVLAVHWSGDGSRIASGSSDGTVRIWTALSY